MAWWDAQHRAPGSSPRSKPRLLMGDAFPRLEPKHIEMERERALLSPVFEDQPGPPTTPALVVHVEIQFTDPVIRSRYYRSYGSSINFEATSRICRGLIRRIERCSEEFLTRKDSTALEMFKDGTYERKPQRFEMTFRILRRGQGEWAERTYRSYQKQPLTVGHTKEVALATHRMIGLFLRRHDEHFRWLDCPVSDDDFDGETVAPSRHGPPSLVSVPRSRFVEATQSFEFVPGYSIELCFRSNNPQRKVAMVEKRLKVTSTQTTPLTSFISEDLLWKAWQAINRGLDLRKQDLEDHLREHRTLDDPRSGGDEVEINLGVSNNLGPAYGHVQRNVKINLALFRHPEATDCDEFLAAIEHYLVRVRNEADARINSMDDFDFQIVELKGVSWTLREPANFTLGPSASYGRRTIQAALDRIQTGIGDVIRGHNIAIHIKAYKRGHLVLDKAIVAHEKRGKPRETFASPEEAKATIAQRLKAQIQKDLDKVFEDSCSIDDIPEDEGHDVRPVTPAQPEQALSDGAPSPMYSPASTRSSPGRRFATLPKPRPQRVFSLSRRSTESVRSIDYLKTAEDPFMADTSRPSTAASEQEARSPLMGVADIKPAQRPFSLVPRRPSSTIRVSNASTLVEEQAADADDRARTETQQGSEAMQQVAAESGRPEAMTSKEAEEEESLAAAPPGTPPAEEPPSSLDLNTASDPACKQLATAPQDDKTGTPPTAGKIGQSKMDTPEIFEDAREFAKSPLPARPVDKLSKALSGTASPRSDDEFLSAPSTPELSTGGSSPRNSVLITPTFLRTDSGTKDPILLGSYPESEPDEIDLPAEVTATPVSKQHHDRPATDAHPTGQPESEQTQPAVSEPEPAVEASGKILVNAETESVAASSESTAVLLSHHDASENEPTSTPTLNATAASSVASNIDMTTASVIEVYNGKLGAESQPESDSASHGPDFPTSEVRTPHPSQGHDHGTVSSGLGSGTVLDTDNRLEQTLEFHIDEAAGNELGTVPGAETKPAEADASKDAPDDVQETPVRDGSDHDHGTESAAVSDAPGVGSEVIPQEAEDALKDEGRKAADESEVPKGDSGPDTAGHTEHDVGSGGVVDGPGLETDEQTDVQGGAEKVTRDVGPAKETEDSREKGDSGPETPEVAVEELIEEDGGPGNGVEGAHVEAETGVVNRVGDTVEENLDLGETGFDSQESLSEPLSEPVVAPSTAENSEPEVAEQVPAPTDTEDDTAVDRSEPDTRDVEDGDAFAVPGQDGVPEEEATVPKLSEEEPLDEGEAQQELTTVPPVTDVADEPEIAKEEPPGDQKSEQELITSLPVVVLPDEQPLVRALAETTGQLVTVPPVTGGPGVELPKEALTEEAFEQLLLVSTVTDAPEAGVPDDAGTAEAEESPTVAVATDDASERQMEEPIGVPDSVAPEDSARKEATEQPIAVSCEAEPVKTGVPGQDVAADAQELLDTVPSVADAAVTEKPAGGTEPLESDSSAEVKESVPAVTDEAQDQGIGEQVAGGAGDSTEAVAESKPGREIGAGTDAGAEALEEDLAEELEVQVDDDVGDVAASWTEALASEPEKNSVEVGPEIDLSGPESAVVDQDLAVELEVQPDGGVKYGFASERNVGAETGKRQEVEVPVPKDDSLKTRVEIGKSAPEPSIASEERLQHAEDPSKVADELDREVQPRLRAPTVAAEPEERETNAPGPNIVNEEPSHEHEAWGNEAIELGWEAQLQADAGREPDKDNSLRREPEAADDEVDKAPDFEADKLAENKKDSGPKPRSRDKQPAVTPPVSAEETTVTPPADVSVLPTEADKPTMPDSITTTTATELPISERASKSAPEETQEKPHFSPISDSKKEQPHPTPIPGFTKLFPVTGSLRPQTARYLGLHERSRFVEVGLLGALGDTRHRRGMSMPVLDQMTGKGGTGGQDANLGSALRGPRADVGEASGAQQEQERGQGAEGDHVLTKMVMLLAGVFVVGKFLQGSSRWEIG